MSKNTTTRRRHATFGMEMLETRKLAANIGPQADVGIDQAETYDAEVTRLTTPRFDTSMDRVDLAIVSGTDPDASMDPVDVDVVFQGGGNPNAAADSLF